MEREQDFDNEIEIDLKDLFLEIISYWQWIILVTIATGAVAFALSRFMVTPMYESTSELYVLSKSTSITSLADIQTGHAAMRARLPWPARSIRSATFILPSTTPVSVATRARRENWTLPPGAG